MLLEIVLEVNQLFDSLLVEVNLNKSLYFFGLSFFICKMGIMTVPN